MAEMEVASRAAPSTKASKRPKKLVEKETFVLTRDEKEELVNFLTTKFDSDAALRKQWVDIKQLSRCRGTVCRVAKAGFAKHLRCEAPRVPLLIPWKKGVSCADRPLGLEHRPTLLHILTRAFEGMVDGSAGTALLAHLSKLETMEKGYRKTVVRRQKEVKNAGRANFRGKMKKHQARH